MNPAFAASVHGLAEAAIARVHGGISNSHDDDVLLAVLGYAERAHAAVKLASDGLGATMRKAAHLIGDPALDTFSDDLAKAADALGETVALLQAVAAEPVQRIPGVFRGTPLHLIGRALH